MHEKNRYALLLALLLGTAAAALPAASSAGEFRLLPAAKVEDGAGLLLARDPATPAGLAASPAAANLVPFEQSAGGLRLTGEDDTSLLTFYVGPSQLASGGVLQIAYQNAVSVLPDTGRVDLTLNGHVAGSFPIRSPNGFKIEKLPVEAAMLKAGRNELRLRVRQHHRVDCSMDATYELWTDLDPVQSGFLAGSATGFSTPDELMALGRNAQGMTEIRLIAADGNAATVARESVSLIQALALFLNRDDLVVTVGSQAGKGAGIDLYVGSGTEPGQTDEARRILANAAAGLSVRAGKVAGRALVTLRGSTATERGNSLLAAVRGPMRAGLDSGVFASKWGALVADAARAYPLHDVGYLTTPFDGRLSRTHFNLDMPADFYPAEYDTMDFYMSGATAPGLALGAQLLVRVNDRVVTSLPFRNGDGEQFDNKRIELPLRAFRPGVNRVELLAEVPVEADAACQPQARTDGKPRFILLDSSTLAIPALARIGRLPDLGAFSGAAYPFGDGKPFDVFVDNPDPRAMATALTTIARLSLAARKPLGAEIVMSQPVETAGRNALIVSTTPAVASAAIAPATTPSGTEGLLGGFAAQADGTDPVTTAALDRPQAEGGDAQALLDAFQATTTVADSKGSLASQAQTWAASAATRFRRWLNYEDPSLSDYTQKDSGALLTMSQIASPTGLANWTVIRADSPDNLALGMTHLADPAVWSRLEGGSASIRTDNGHLVTQPATARIITEITDPSFGNFRRLAASWFSDNFQIYVILVIVLLGGFGAWLGFVVPKKGVRTDQ